MKNKKKKRGMKNQFMVDGPIHTKVDGTKKGRQGYNRKDKKWKDEE